MKTRADEFRDLTLELTTETLELSDVKGRTERTYRLNAPFRNRRFLALDGEGITPAGQREQFYALIGSNDGIKTKNLTPKNDECLSSFECLQFIIDQRIRYPDHIMVAFAANYDVTMILRDFTDDQLGQLFNGETVPFCTFRVQYLRGKWLRVYKDDIHAQIFDTFSFFGCSFLVACGQYLADDEDYKAVIASVEDGKAARNEFTYDQMDSLIKPYMHRELILMVRLMERLRELLASIGIHPGMWHGPGAIADALLNKHQIRKYRTHVEPSEIVEASQFAYMGGRFEAFKMGLYYGDVYSYDIRSAYPYALTQLPALDDQYYIDRNPSDIPDFSLCRVSYANNSIARTAINPIALRSARSAVFYPAFVETWVFGCEYKVAKKWFPNEIECSMVIRFNDDGRRPFDFVNDLFEERQRFQLAKNPVQLACKLGMNSIYGKLAQRVGKNNATEAPKNHQLRWAGYCTAKCRAMALDAMMQSPDSIIAVETDGIYSEKPLCLDIGTGLGQFEEKQYSGMLFIQSGVYFTQTDGEWNAGKTRGVGKRRLGKGDKDENLEVALRNVNSLSALKMTHNKFYALPGYMGSEKLRHWELEDHNIQWGGGGKREHREEDCSGCAENGVWHQTVWTTPTGKMDGMKSHKHSLPWLEKKAEKEAELCLSR